MARRPAIALSCSSPSFDQRCFAWRFSCPQLPSIWSQFISRATVTAGHLEGKEQMQTIALNRLVAVILGCCFSCAVLAESPNEKRAEIRKMRAETLARLYALHPAAKGKIGGAYGYAVFTNGGVNLVFISVAAGRGIA